MTYGEDEIDEFESEMSVSDEYSDDAGESDEADPVDDVESLLDSPLDEEDIEEEPSAHQQESYRDPEVVKKKVRRKPVKKAVKKVKPVKVVKKPIKPPVKKAAKKIHKKVVPKPKPKSKSASPKKHAKEKIVKKKKPGKRGPHGAQWLRWSIPYQETAIMGQLYKLALKKGGIKRKDAVKFVMRKGGDPGRALKYLLSGHSKGWIWDVDDAHDRIRVSNHRIGNKHWKKAA